MNFSPCIYRDSVRVKLILSPKIDLTADTVICSLPLVLNLGDTISQIHWSMGTNGPGVVITTKGTYYVTVTKNGCNSVDSILIIGADTDLSIVFPNIITPNGDGLNDFLELKITHVEVSKFYLYNRWGKLVYSVNDAAIR